MAREKAGQKDNKPKKEEKKDKKPSPATPPDNPPEPASKPDPEEVKRNILHGQLKLINPEQLNRIIKVYISSAGTDTAVERNALVSRVYPSLKRFCRESGYELQIIDMRWGAKPEDDDDHSVSFLSLQQLEKCLNSNFFFVSLLAQKYGDQILLQQIPLEEFEKICSFVEKEDDQELMTSWYLRDDNHVTPMYILQPITTRIPDFVEDDRGKRKDAQNEWAATSEKLKILIKNAATQAFAEDPDILQKYVMSAAEQEIQHGIINNKNHRETCVWFHRNFDDITKYKHHSISSHLDVENGKVNEQTLQYLDDIKRDKLHQYLAQCNIVEYSLKWKEKGIDIDSCEEHKKYVDKLCKDVERVLHQMITATVNQNKDKYFQDRLARNVYKHVAFAKNAVEVFCGREQFLEQIQQKIGLQVETGKRQPLVLSGPPGSGRTAIMAKLAELMPDWLGKKDCVIIPRFLGLSREHMSTQNLLTSLIQQLHYILKQKDLSTKELKDLKREFQKLLKEVKVPVVILLDGVELLTDEGEEVKDWLPAKLPPNVTIILSSLPVGECEIISKFKKLLTSQSFLTLPSFGRDDNEASMLHRLTIAKRKLTKDQKKLVEKTSNTVGLPLFTDLFLGQAICWNSYLSVNDIEVPLNLDAIINNLFDSLERKHGKIFVSHTLGYITASRRGISVAELEDILSLDDEVLNDVFKHSKAPLRRFPPILWAKLYHDLQQLIIEIETDDVTALDWSHQKLRDAAENRYLAEDKRNIHSIMAEYFIGSWAEEIPKPYEDQSGKKKEAVRYVASQPLVIKQQEEKNEAVFNKRVLTELPYHLIMSEREDELLDICLANFDFMYCKLKCHSVDGLLEDYDIALESESSHPDIEKVKNVVKQCRPALEYEAEQLPAQLNACLPPMGARNSKRLTKLLNQALTPSFNCLFTSQDQSTGSENGDQIAKYVGHEGDVQCIDVSKNRSRIISCGTDGTLRIWNTENGHQVGQLDVDPSDPSQQTNTTIKCKFCMEDKSALVIGNLVQVWDLFLGRPVKTLDVPLLGKDPVLAYILSNTTTLITVSTEMLVWDLNSGKKVDDMKVEKPGKMAKHIPSKSMVDQLAGFDNTVVLYRRATRFIHVTEFADKKKTSKKFDILGKKMELNHPLIIGCSSSGLLAYMFYEIKEDRDPQPFTVGIIDLRNIKNIDKVFETNQIEMGIHSGLLEAKVFSTGEDEFVFTTCPDDSSTVVYVWRPPTEVIKLVASVKDRLQCVTSVGDGKVLLTTGTTPSEIQLKDVRFAEEHMDKEIQRDSREPLPGLLYKHVAGSNRHMYYLTNDDRIAVWDLALRSTTRLINSPFYLPYAAMLSESKVIGILASQSKEESEPPCLIHADLQYGNVINEKVATSWDIPNFNFRVHHIGNDAILYPGPKPHQITALKLTTGKVLWTLQVKDTEEIGGLIVSEDNRLLIAESPVSPEQLKEDSQNPEEKEVFLYCFDLQQRRRLADLKAIGIGALSTSLTETQQAVLTPDGKHYISIIGTSDGIKTAVWETKSGKKRWLGADDKELGEPLCMVFSKALRSLIVSYGRNDDDNDGDGKIILWSLNDGTQMKQLVADATKMCVSLDGLWLAYVSALDNNTTTVHNLKSDKRFGSYYAADEVASFMFSSNAEFLLLSMKNKKGLLQLCLYDAQQQRELDDKQSKQGDNNKGDKGQSKSDANTKHEETSDQRSLEKYRMENIGKENDIFEDYKVIDIAKEFEE